MVFDVTMFLLDNKDRIVTFVQSIFNTIGPIAQGKLGKASKAVEDAMGRTVPLILGILGAVAGVSGIGNSISKAIMSLTAPIQRAVELVVNKLVDFAKKAFKSGKAGLKKVKDKVLSWWKKEKKFKNKKGESHRIYFKKKGKKYVGMIASSPMELEAFVNWYQKEKLPKENVVAGSEEAIQVQKCREVKTLISNIERNIQQMNQAPNNQKQAQSDRISLLYDQLASQLFYFGFNQQQEQDAEIPDTKSAVNFSLLKSLSKQAPNYMKGASHLWIRFKKEQRKKREGHDNSPFINFGFSGWISSGQKPSRMNGLHSASQRKQPTKIKPWVIPSPVGGDELSHIEKKHSRLPLNSKGITIPSLKKSMSRCTQKKHHVICSPP